MHIALDRSHSRAAPDGALFADSLAPQGSGSHGAEDKAVTVVGAAVGLLLIVLLMTILVLVAQSQRSSTKELPKVSASMQPILRSGFDCRDTSLVKAGGFSSGCPDSYTVSDESPFSCCGLISASDRSSPMKNLWTKSHQAQCQAESDTPMT